MVHGKEARLDSIREEKAITKNGRPAPQQQEHGTAEGRRRDGNVAVRRTTRGRGPSFPFGIGIR